MKLNGKVLSDSFFLSGNDFEEFKNNVNDFKETIRFHRIRSSELQLLSHIATSKNGETDYLFKVGEKEVSIQKEIILRTLIEGGFDLAGTDEETELKNLECRYRRANVKLEKSSLLAKGDFSSLLDELRESNKLMLSIPGNKPLSRKFVFTTESLLATLDRFGLKGGFLSRPSLARDVLVEQELIDGNKEITLVCREINGVEKCFAILSGKYKPIDQSVIFSLIERIEKDGLLGKPECREWFIDHYYTRVYIDFPDKAKELTNHFGKKECYTPGICISTSDTGDCSLKVAGTFRVGNSLVTENEILHKHIGEYDEDDFIKEVIETVFAEFTILPAKLCDLMMVDIGDTTLDLSKAENRVLNAEFYKDVLASAFNQLGITAAVGIKVKKQLFEGMLLEIDPSLNYTAYDIAVSLMKLPERVGKIPSLPNLQKAVGRAPYINYDSGSSIVLV